MTINTVVIKLLLAEQDMTQAELAEKIGLSRQSVSTVLTRKLRPRKPSASWPPVWASDRKTSSTKGAKSMIQLTKDLWVKADDHCYIVGNLRERRGKGAELRNPTYYTTMDQAVQGALILFPN